MATIKIAEATNIQIDYLVAKVEGALAPLGNVQLIDGKWLLICVGGDPDHGGSRVYFKPTTDYNQGMPILELNGVVTLEKLNSGDWRALPRYDFDNDRPGLYSHGPNLLIAGLRCYLVSKLGETAEVPDELAEKGEIA